MAELIPEPLNPVIITSLGGPLGPLFTGLGILEMAAARAGLEIS
jgi:hypothetical protein